MSRMMMMARKKPMHVLAEGSAIVPSPLLQRNDTGLPVSRDSEAIGTVKATLVTLAWLEREWPKGVWPSVEFTCWRYIDSRADTVAGEVPNSSIR